MYENKYFMILGKECLMVFRGFRSSPFVTFGYSGFNPKPSQKQNRSVPLRGTLYGSTFWTFFGTIPQLTLPKLTLSLPNSQARSSGVFLALLTVQALDWCWRSISDWADRRTDKKESHLTEALPFARIRFLWSHGERCHAKKSFGCRPEHKNTKTQKCVRFLRRRMTTYGDQSILLHICVRKSKTWES